MSFLQTRQVVACENSNSSFSSSLASDMLNFIGDGGDKVTIVCDGVSGDEIAVIGVSGEDVFAAVEFFFANHQTLFSAF